MRPRANGMRGIFARRGPTYSVVKGVKKKMGICVGRCIDSGCRHRELLFKAFRFLQKYLTGSSVGTS